MAAEPQPRRSTSDQAPHRFYVFGGQFGFTSVHGHLAPGYLGASRIVGKGLGSDWHLWKLSPATSQRDIRNEERQDQLLVGREAPEHGRFEAFSIPRGLGRADLEPSLPTAGPIP